MWKAALAIFLLHVVIAEQQEFVVPNIVHQIYDYQYPSFFLFLSLQCVQHYIRPEKHILWINDEGRYRRAHWDTWIGAAKHHQDVDSEKEESHLQWEIKMANMIEKKIIDARFITFPTHPPGNSSIIVTNKAHRSDFVRLSALEQEGGIYLDTDVFPFKSLDDFRVFNFTIGYDNIVNPDRKAPKRLNNGVLLSSPKSDFTSIWSSTYHNFNPNSWDHHSSIVPFDIATEYPDLVHIEMSRLSPMSYAFQTSESSLILTCGILMKKDKAILHPVWDRLNKKYTYESVHPDTYVYKNLNNKYLFHLTMSAVRGVSMLRKNLGGVDDLKYMPSLLGSIFRTAFSNGVDTFNYDNVINMSNDEKLKNWEECRNHFGMVSSPDDLILFGGQYDGPYATPSHKRQQYVHNNNYKDK
jgi:hypothetical protein